MVEDKDFKRGDNESEEDYQIRICSLKDSKHLTWEDIADILNAELGYDYTESRYRRQYATYLRGYQRREQEIESEVEGIDLEFSKEEEEWRKRYGVSGGKTMYYRMLRQDGRFERFYHLIGENIKRLDPPDLLHLTIPDTIKQNKKEWVMTLADLHIGACFESVNNSYSIKIAQERFERLLNETAAFCEVHNINKLNIISLGDVVQGILRISDLKLNEMAVVDAFVIAMRLIADFLNKLSAVVRIDFYQVCYSNHDQTRPLGTKASELGGEDLGKILYAYLTDTLEKNKRIKIIADPKIDYLEFNIFGFSCIALHGHQIKTATTLYKDLASRHHKFYDYIFVGHTHSMKNFVNAECNTYDAETLVSSSFIGSDPYADKLMVGSKAAVMIHEFEAVKGRVASYKIILN